MMTLEQAARVVDGVLEGESRAFSAVSTDTRSELRDSLFIALRGERFDAHDFLAEAAARGAAGAMVAADAKIDVPSLTLIRVADTRRALSALAGDWRARFSVPVIGVTGSNGKTTVKEMCAAILRTWLGESAVLATAGNLNNDIGVPLMLLRLRAQHQAAVIEMGMNHPGEIAPLAGLARPDVAIVTNAQRAHLEGMGGLGSVAQEKGAIYRALTAAGVAVINADDDHADGWRLDAGQARCVSFGLKPGADVTAEARTEAFGSHVRLRCAQGQIDFELPIPGRHNVLNALGAAAACLAAGAPLEAVARGLAGFTGAGGRLQRRQAERGAILLDDTYNANPDSVRAAIDVLTCAPGQKILVLGDMGEIGDMSAQYHDEIGGYAKSAGVDRLFALGEHSALAARNFGAGGEFFASGDALVEALRAALGPDVVVLVKGSRFMRMERIANAVCPPQQV